MKLNLPSTWTSQKISGLFLTTFFHSLPKTEAGQSFANCMSNNAIQGNNVLTGQIDNKSYNHLSNHVIWNNDADINNGKIATVCCDDIQCQFHDSWLNCGNQKVFYCNKINQSKPIFCYNAYLPKCSGIVGDDIITSSAVMGNCSSSLSNVMNYTLSVINQTYFADGNYFYLDCQQTNVSPCSGSSCNWDNGGWTCSHIGSSITSLTENCYYQWPAPWPGPADKNPLISTSATTSTSSLIIFPSSAPTNNNLTITNPSFTPTTNNPTITTPNNPYLVEEIAIPLGVSVVSISGLTYCLVRKNKKKSQQNRQSDIELQENITNQDDILAALKKLSPNQLRNLQRGDTTLSREITYYSPLLSKETELTNLRGTYVNKAFDYQDIEKDLDELLELETKIFIDDSRYLSEQQKNEVKSGLIKKTPLTENELDHLCQLQIEIIKLKNKLAKQRRRLTHKEIQQINYIVNIQHGHAIVNSQLGDNANLSYNIDSVEVPEDTQHLINQIQQPPKSYFQK